MDRSARSRRRWVTLRIEFFDKLMEDESTARVRRVVDKGFIDKDWFTTSYRRFKPLRFDSMRVSIQGSLNHYCAPRETFDNPSIYSAMEVGVFEKVGENSKWIDVVTDKRFHDFDLREGFLAYEEQAGVYSFVPVEMIEKLYQYLNRRYSLGSRDLPEESYKAEERDVAED